MAKTDFVKPNDVEFITQMTLFKTNIGQHAATLDITPAEIAAQAADCDYFNYIWKCHVIMQSSALALTTAKKATRLGDPSATPGTAPSGYLFPTFPDAPPVVAPGVETRFRALAKKIKAHPHYTIGIGDALDIESPTHTAPDLNTLQPVVSVELSGNKIHVGWGWGGHSAYLDMIEIQVDRGDGKGFVLLAYDTTPGYLDPAPMPVALTKWKYRAIYRVGDQRVGEWSAETAITVGG